jgi:uncharacterized protein with GYD domain
VGRYLISASYTLPGLQGLIREGGSGRREAVRNLAEELGGSLEVMYFTFGERDVFAIVELPTTEAAAALAMSIGASGSVAHATTTVLLTPEEIDRARTLARPHRPAGG